MNHNDTTKLAQLIEQKYRCLEQIHALGARQLEWIAAGDIAQVLKILSAKDRLLAALQAVERLLAPFRDQDPETRDWPSSAERTACAEQAQACSVLLRQILEQERQSESQIGVHRDDVAQRLNSGAVAAHAAQAYLDEPLPAVSQFDLSTNPS